MTALHTWSAISAVVLTSVAGDVLLAKGMRAIGDFDHICAASGIPGVVKRVLMNAWFVTGVACMALSFFSLLLALSWADVSLVAPAAASLTFVGNAAAAHFFLNEHVDARRWIAALLVCAGVGLLAISH